MRFALALLCVCCSVSALAQQTRKPVVALLPPEGDEALRPLGLLIEARASELLEHLGKTTELHLKQSLAVEREEGLDLSHALKPEAVQRIRMALGADHLVTTSLKKSAKGSTLTLAIVDEKKRRTVDVALPADWPQALKMGSERIVHELLPGKHRFPESIQPGSANAEALTAFARCYGVVLDQPLGIEQPSLLDAPALERAVADCTKAVELDEGFTFARATLALAQALAGDDAGAAASLKSLKDADDVIEAYSLARFWLLTRYQSNEAGVAYLRDVVARHPGELIAHSYLAETLVALGQHEAALAAWDAYLALAPASPYAHARKSKPLARLGRHEEAVASARKAITHAPNGHQAQLEMGSRLIDAGAHADAITVLEALTKTPGANAEHTLRLGWAHWLTGDGDAAAPMFEKALAMATTPAEWRTRGRAHYNLALVAVKRGKPDDARAALEASMRTGLKLRTIDPALKDIARKLERSALTKQKQPAADAPTMVPRETSLFPVDAFGELAPKAKKPPPPHGLVLYRF